MENHLKPEILAQIKRLGGQMQPQHNSIPTHIKGIAVPAPMQEFFYHIFWPDHLSFCSSEESNYWVWDVRLNVAVDWLDEEDFVISNRRNRELVIVGTTDGGNYLLIMDLKDKTPENPRIYKIDHYDPEQQLGNGVSLSDFLGDLYPETPARCLLLEAGYLTGIDTSPDQLAVFEEAVEMADLPEDYCAAHLARVIVYANLGQVEQALSEIMHVEKWIARGVSLSPEEHLAFQQSLVRLMKS